MPSNVYYIFAAIASSIGVLGSLFAALIWLFKMGLRLGNLITKLESNQTIMEQKISKMIKMFSKIEDHNVRLAVVETKVENLQAQNGKHKEYDT
jgi:hypothetical protein